MHVPGSSAVSSLTAKMKNSQGVSVFISLHLITRAFCLTSVRAIKILLVCHWFLLRDTQPQLEILIQNIHHSNVRATDAVSASYTNSFMRDFFGVV